jgi:aryl-alcohol dehydrogenase-like predicted oxidoreductase
MSASRRRLLGAGVLVGLGAVLPGCAADSAARATNGAEVITKPIPATRERIPVIGIGADSFGKVEPSVLRNVLQHMHSQGGTVIDTAGLYPGSEAAIGTALQDMNLRSKVFISTKVNAVGVTQGGPPPGPGVVLLPDDPVRGMDSIQRSLQRLKTDQIDLLQAHWIDSIDPLMPVLHDLKSAGRVRYIGVTNSLPELQPKLAPYLRKYRLDFVQVEYRLNDRSAEQEILPLAQEHGVAVMVARPFGVREKSLFAQIGKRELPAWAVEFGINTWAQFFLKYAVSHPAVTCAIPGSIDAAHVDENQAAGQGKLPDAAMRRRMEMFWNG